MRIRILLAACLAALAGCGGTAPEVPMPEAPTSMTVTSPAFSEGEEIPRRHTCDGANISPPLRFGGVPDGTAELALVVEDPDAPGGTFVHWVAWGIDPASPQLTEGEQTPGAGRNGFGGDGYRGPCPPKGAPHRYVFTVYAVARPLRLPPGASAGDLRRAMAGQVLAQGSLTARYARS